MLFAVRLWLAPWAPGALPACIRENWVIIIINSNSNSNVIIIIIIVIILMLLLLLVGICRWLLGRRRRKVRPVHLLRVSLLRVLESNFPGDPL